MDLDLGQIIVLSGLAVTAATQILKLKVVPVSFANRYPVITNVLLSVVAAVVVQWQNIVNLVSWTDYVAYVGIVAVVAAVTYNQLVGKSTELKQMEGSKSTELKSIEGSK